MTTSASGPVPLTAVEVPGRDAAPRMSDYDQERRRFCHAVPERFNPVLDILEPWARERSDELALLSLDATGEVVARQSAADLAHESRRAGRALLRRGVRKGDPVFLMLPHVPAWYAVLLGAMRIGAVPMPAATTLTSLEIAYRLDRGEAVVAVTDREGAAKIDAIEGRPPALVQGLCWTDGGAAPDGWESLDALLDEAGDGDTPQDPTSRDDALLLYFTSGTASLPRMVLHPMSYALGHLGTARFWQDLRSGDLHWTVADTGSAKVAWGGLFGQWLERAGVVQANLREPDAHVLLSILARHRITSLCASPALYAMLAKAELTAHDLSRLRHCTSTGGPLDREVARAWSRGTGGLTIYDGYGQTETTCVLANYRAVPLRPGSMGKPVPGYDVEVVGPAGQPVPSGFVGDLAVRAEPRPVGLFRGYHRDAEATAGRFRDGWYYTGDRARRDADGYFWFEGRDRGSPAGQG